MSEDGEWRVEQFTIVKWWRLTGGEEAVTG
jgi:hypothetical protein